MSYGFYRSEILGALFSTIVIWLLTGILVYIAIIRIIDHNFEIEPIPMLITASSAVIFNIFMYFILHTNSLICDIKKKLGVLDIKSTDENLNKEDLNDKEIDVETTIIANISLRSISAHVVGDLIQSLGVLIAAIIVYIKVL
jgi:cation diffusion facilitator family transporter